MKSEILTLETRDTTCTYAAGVAAPSRLHLLAYADEFISGITPTGQPYLEVVLPCGNVRKWLTRDDVPGLSIECRCGDLDYPHYFIKYTEKP